MRVHGRVGNSRDGQSPTQNASKVHSACACDAPPALDATDTVRFLPSFRGPSKSTPPSIFIPDLSVYDAAAADDLVSIVCLSWRQSTRQPSVRPRRWAEGHRWTLAWMTWLIFVLRRVRYTSRGASYLLHRIGWSPRNVAVERDEDRVLPRRICAALDPGRRSTSSSQRPASLSNRRRISALHPQYLPPAKPVRFPGRLMIVDTVVGNALRLNLREVDVEQRGDTVDMVQLVGALVSSACLGVKEHLFVSA